MDMDGTLRKHMVVQKKRVSFRLSKGDSTETQEGTQRGTPRT